MKKLRVSPEKLGNLTEGSCFIDGPRFNSRISTCLDRNLRPRVEWAVCFFLNNPGIEERYEYSSAQSCLWICQI